MPPSDSSQFWPVFLPTLSLALAPLSKYSHFFGPISHTLYPGYPGHLYCFEQPYSLYLSRECALGIDKWPLDLFWGVGGELFYSIL